MRKLIIRSFYINVSGLSRDQAKEQIEVLKDNCKMDNMPNDIKENYFIEDVWFPILQGDSKVEIIYPSKFDVDDLNLEDLNKLINKLQEIRNKF